MATIEELFSANNLERGAATLNMFLWMRQNTNAWQSKSHEEIFISWRFIGEHIQSHEYKPIIDMYGVDMARSIYKYFAYISESDLAQEVAKQIDEWQEKETLSVDEFANECTNQWKAVSNLLTLGSLKDKTWTDLLDIHNTLDRIGKMADNYMLFPAGGGMALAGSEFVREDFCFGLLTKGGGTTYIVKPASLSYVHIDDEGDFSYYLLQLKQLQRIPSEFEDAVDSRYQQDVRDNGSEYISISDYNSVDNPKEYFGDTRIVVRMLAGQIMIVKKTGVLDRLNNKTGAPNLKMLPEELKEDISKARQLFLERQKAQS